MISGNAVINCPFCGEPSIKAIHKPSYIEGRVSRISSGAKTTYHRVPERYEMLSGCAKCGKSKKEVQKAFETGVTEETSHEERIKRLKEAGIPTKIESRA